MGNDKNRIDFGKIMGNKRADYTAVYVHSSTDEVYVDKYRNDDKGGTKLKGDGTRYCDMTGDGMYR